MIVTMFCAVLLTVVVAIPYSIYLLNIRNIKLPKTPTALSALPNISIVIPTHNEAKTIGARISNIVDGSYPTDKIEVVIVNDASEDKTVDVALAAFEHYSAKGLKGVIINNIMRLGVNRTMEKGIKATTNEIVVCTDADVLFDKFAVEKIVAELINKKEVGAVSGDLQPKTNYDENITTQTEQSYRSVYGDICVWESKIASSFSFNGALYAIKKSVAELRVENGAYDAGIALSIIRKGHKTIYLPTATVFENNIPKTVREQARQKIRRASRLLKATGNNLDMMGRTNGNFGRVVLPLRFLSYFVVPTCFFIAIGMWLYIAAEVGVLPLAFAALLVFTLFTIKQSTIVSSFIIHQFYLVCGLLNYPNQRTTWKLVDRMGTTEK